MREFRRILAALGVTVLIVGCAPAVVTSPATTNGESGSTTAPATPGNSSARATRDITVVLPADIKSLDKAIEETFNSTNITLNIFDRLVRYDKDSKPAPMLATSWEITNDTTWRFHLRAGVRFQDGEPFDAAAVKYTMDRANRDGSVLAYYLTNVSAVNVVDDHTVDFVTKLPDPILPNRIGAWIDIVPPKAGESPDFGTKPVGSGPFRFVEWVQGDYVTLERNPDYWGDQVGIDHVTYRFVSEVSTRQSMLLSGDADIIPNVPADLAAAIDASGVAKTLAVPGFRKMTLILDPKVAPLGDVRVRQALNYALDKRLIIESVLGGDAVQATGLVHAAVDGYNADLTDFYAFNPDKARQLLSDAGYVNGFDLTFYHTVGTFPKDKEIAEAVADQLGKVGIRVTLQPTEFGDLYDNRLSGGKLNGMALMRWGNAKADPSELYTWCLWSKGETVYVTDPQMDKLIEQSEATMDPTARLALFRQMEDTTVKTIVPWGFLFDLKNVFGVSSRLSWTPASFEPIDLRGAAVS